jgi:hypothetical protein
MRKVLLTLALLGLAVGGANADPSVLADGIFFAHYVPELPYSTDPPAVGWCDAYLDYAVGSVAEVNARIDCATYCPVVWYVLAAWGTEDKTWCGTEFGLGAFDAGLFGFVEAAPCFPVEGLEIPTAGWPGPNEGTAFVVTGDPWMGNWVPVYYFGGYAYGYAAPGDIPLDVDPPTGFAGFGNCLAPPQSFPAYALGSMGINYDGIVPDFPEPPMPWACCFDDGRCQMLTEADCAAAGGIAWLEQVTCEPNPCDQPGACCIGGNCVVNFEEECMMIGGQWLGPNTVCSPNPCPAVCCFGHECVIILEEECLQGGGYWHPEWTSCEPNPCEIYTPADNTSWGEIKAIYR